MPVCYLFVICIIYLLYTYNAVTLRSLPMNFIKVERHNYEKKHTYSVVDISVDHSKLVPAY